MNSVRKKQLIGDLNNLDSLDNSALRMLWRKYFSDVDPHGLRKSYMQDELAYSIQAKLHGSLPKPIKRQIRRLAHEKVRTVRAKAKIAEGVELVRIWQGTRHTVKSVAGGFEYQGTVYNSLSKVARMITGARWSGPVFFGLKAGRSGKVAS